VRSLYISRSGGDESDVENMESQRKNLLLMCSLSLILPACAPSLPMLAIGGVAYIVQTQLSKSQDSEDPPSEKKTAVKPKNTASKTLAEKDL
jgi:flagellar biosynthesis component FlhA